MVYNAIYTEVWDPKLDQSECIFCSSISPLAACSYQFWNLSHCTFILNVCYSTVTGRVLLNWPQLKIGPHDEIVAL